MKSYDHNIRIREMERAAKGLVRRGGNERRVELDGLVGFPNARMDASGNGSNARLVS